jgi:hypothetical protein
MRSTPATLIGTSDAYIAGHNERLMASAVAGPRDKVQYDSSFPAPARPPPTDEGEADET